MKVKLKIATIILFFFSLSSILFIISDPLLYFKRQIETDQLNDEKDSFSLKISLSEDWNITWDMGNNEYGQSVVVDENTGDIYVTGYNATVNNDILLSKYNNNGEEQWNITWDNGLDEYGYDVALDSLGNIYVAGGNGTLYPNFDFLLAKFNSSGGLVWKRTYDGGSYDGAWALTIDPQDMIYVVGQTITASEAVLLLKYNSSGHLQWSSVYEEPGYQAGRDIVLDSFNNIYVSGVNRPTGLQNDLLIIKFNNSGIHLWNRTWGGPDPDEGWCLTLDSRNNVYSSGYTESYGAEQKDYVVVKYDSEGNWLWNRTWGTVLSEETRGISVDSADNIYLGGFALGSNISLLKYDVRGNLLWHKSWEKSPTLDHYCKDLIIDSSDKIYITGEYWVNPTYDPFLIKLSIESPGGFELSPPTGTIDDDGDFTLSWTVSLRANNYSIFESSSLITEVNDSLTIIANETNTFSLPISGYSNGIYYFKAVAFNNYGNSTSNGIAITVSIPGPSTQPQIPGYNLIILCLLIGVISVIVIIKRLKFK